MTGWKTNLTIVGRYQPAKINDEGGGVLYAERVQAGMIGFCYKRGAIRIMKGTLRLM
jgi:hypothetical protein